MLATAEQVLVRSGRLHPGDVLGVVAGTQMSTGSTNFMRLHIVSADEVATNSDTLTNTSATKARS
jgi:hypothetical protein